MASPTLGGSEATRGGADVTGAADCARRLGEGARHVTEASIRLRNVGLIEKEWSDDERGTVIDISAQPSACIVAHRNGAGQLSLSAASPALSVLTLYEPVILSALVPVRLTYPMRADAEQPGYDLTHNMLYYPLQALLVS